MVYTDRKGGWTHTHALTGSVHMARLCEASASTASVLNRAALSTLYTASLTGSSMTNITTKSAYSTRSQVRTTHTTPHASQIHHGAEGCGDRTEGGTAHSSGRTYPAFLSMSLQRGVTATPDILLHTHSYTHTHNIVLQGDRQKEGGSNRQTESNRDRKTESDREQASKTETDRETESKTEREQ